MDNTNHLLGIITDDLRRIITKSQKHYSALMMESVKVFLNKKPIAINNLDTSLDTIKKIFIKNKILDLVVVDDDYRVLGIIHIHDILKNMFSREKIKKKLKSRSKMFGLAVF